MQTINSEQNIMFDVDETLIMHNVTTTSSTLFINCPYDNTFVWKVNPHSFHIGLLKRYKKQGYGILVWSAAGAKWAEAVIRALELESFVDYTLVKPIKYVDDLTSDKILGTRVYISHAK